MRSPQSQSRSRSRSPSRHHRNHHHRDRSDYNNRHDHGRSRSERDSRHRHRHTHYHRDRHSQRDTDKSSSRQSKLQPDPKSEPVILPFQARELLKRDLEVFKPMFAMYLDIQKGIFLEDLAEEEVKGRWKSFIGKWNRGELAEGWYDPGTFERAQNSISAAPPPAAGSKAQQRGSPDYECRRSESESAGRKDVEGKQSDDEEEEEEEYGPILPGGDRMSGPSSGPTIPTMQDLRLRNESAIEDAIEERQDSRNQLKAKVRSHRSQIRQMEDDVAPRAEPGTHERRVEKRREAAASNRAFAESGRRGGSPADGAPDDELMGSGENDLDTIKSAKEREQRRKNEREIRREEILRARAAEREERLQRYRAKEDETIGWLKNLAKQRFG